MIHDVGEDEETPSETESAAAAYSEPQSKVSLHAFTGTFLPQTLRLPGKNKNKDVVVHIDGDFLVLHVAACCVVLGVKWLKTLGLMEIDNQKLTTGFKIAGATHTFQGLKANELQAVPDNELVALQGLAYLLQIEPFGDHRGLPPIHSQDHQIPLLPNARPEDISMDFIEGLSTSNGFTTIMVVVDRLSKYAYFVLIRHPFTAATIAKEFVSHVVKLHGIPSIIGRPTKKIGRLALMLEFTYNTSVHSATKMTPFEVVYGRPPPRVLTYVPGTSKVQVVEEFLIDWDKLLRDLCSNLLVARDRMKSKADSKRREAEFSVGDMVYLKLQSYRESTVAVCLSAKVDIEGLPSAALTQKTFTKLAGRWGELLYVEDPGKVYGLRAREITGWDPESIEDASEFDTDVESDDDPLVIYDLLNKKVVEKEIEQVVSDDPSDPPEFTEDVELEQKIGEVDRNVDKEGGFDDTFKPVSQLGMSSPAVGNSGGVLCVWDILVFVKSHVFMLLKEISKKRLLWDYLHGVFDRWKGEVILMGDFNEVHMPFERRGLIFNKQGAALFNFFILSSGLIEVSLGGYMFTWEQKDAAKMSKLDRFLVSRGLMTRLSMLSGIILDRHLSDHMPILLRELVVNYGPTPFQLFHSLFMLNGFDRVDLLSTRRLLCKELLDIDNVKVKELAQKAKVKWAIKGDENWNSFTFRFGPKWRGWIMRCLKSSTGSVLVNGSPTKEFQFHKGLHQGDPLSPFLFLLITESLHISFSKAMNQGFSKGIKIGSSDTVCLFHLFYADDTVFIGEWNEENLLNIVRILQCFFLAFNLRINLHKCSIIGVGGVKTEEVSRKATLIGCDIGKTPFKYLGVMVVKAIHGFHRSLDRIPQSSKSSTWIECVKGMIQLNKNGVDLMSFVSKRVKDNKEKEKIKAKPDKIKSKREA
uniref:RNA-directed DNA polymerase, eukaryota n=1 Tax=Tanacetum cinerariifolium TaxID=118510 RepID=A0A6L2KB25_TANCI|nr:RNA-directed DNA polymerase, eukaryota [Tanacetum cinerariifolium]